jgi:hypothetical protein
LQLIVVSFFVASLLITLFIPLHSDQEMLLNPTLKNVVMGQLLNDAVGEGARKKIAK